MKIYAYGATPDHFTGWGGVGKPVYGSTASTNTSLANLFSTSMNTSTASGEPNGWGIGCCWLPLTTQPSSCWLSLWGTISGAAAATDASAVNQSPLLIHFASGGYLMIKPSTSTNYTMRLVLSPSLTDTTQYIDLGIPYAAAYSTVTKLNINISGCGTTSGVIAWYNDGTLIGSWTGDLTDYTAVSAVSVHRDTVTSASYYLTYAYLLVTDVCTIGSSVNYEIISGTQGTRADWVGDTASFSAYPVDYTTTDGLYATAQSATCTFKPSKTYSLPTTTGAQLGTVLLQGSLVSDITDAAVAPYVLDGATSGAGTSTTLSTTGKNYSFNLTTNPATGVAWTMADINAVELGFIRTDDDVSTTS